MMARSQFPDASAEVERLRVELERWRKDNRKMALDVLAASGQAQEAYEAQLAAEARADRLQAERDDAIESRDNFRDAAKAAIEAANAFKAERDDLAARLQQIQQAERKYTAAKLTEAAKMRKGQAI